MWNVGNADPRSDWGSVGRREGMLDDIEELSPEDIIERNQLYLSERNERKIYMDKALHITFLQLIFSLLLTPMYSPPLPSLSFFFFFFVLCSTVDVNALIVVYHYRGTLQPLYTDQFPVNNKKLNIPFLLHSRAPIHVSFLSLSFLFIFTFSLATRHTDINHPANGPIIPELVERSLEMKVRRRTPLVKR